LLDIQPGARMSDELLESFIRQYIEQQNFQGQTEKTENKPISVFTTFTALFFGFLPDPNTSRIRLCCLPMAPLPLQAALLSILAV